jgi:hypothetical protein
VSKYKWTFNTKSVGRLFMMYLRTSIHTPSSNKHTSWSTHSPQSTEIQLVQWLTTGCMTDAWNQTAAEICQATVPNAASLKGPDLCLQKVSSANGAWTQCHQQLPRSDAYTQRPQGLTPGVTNPRPAFIFRCSLRSSVSEDITWARPYLSRFPRQ